MRTENPPTRPTWLRFESRNPWPSWWHWLFAIPHGPADEEDVAFWWRERRLTYNLFVLGFGAPSFILYVYFMFSSGQLNPTDDFDDPFTLLFAPLVINLYYSLGSFAELKLRKATGAVTRKAGRLLMQLGVGFTLFVILFPTVTWGSIWFWHVIVLRH